MMRRFLLLMTLGLAACVPSFAQALVFDRGPQTPPHRAAAWTKDAKGLVADDFRIGKSGEIWMIDRIRVWAVVHSAKAVPAELYSNLTLFGGLVDPANSNKPRPPEDCDC